MSDGLQGHLNASQTTSCINVRAINVMFEVFFSVLPVSVFSFNFTQSCGQNPIVKGKVGS